MIKSVRKIKRRSQKNKSKTKNFDQLILIHKNKVFISNFVSSVKIGHIFTLISINMQILNLYDKVHYVAIC